MSSWIDGSKENSSLYKLCKPLLINYVYTVHFGKVVFVFVVYFCFCLFCCLFLFLFIFVLLFVFVFVYFCFVVAYICAVCIPMCK